MTKRAVLIMVAAIILLMGFCLGVDRLVVGRTTQLLITMPVGCLMGIGAGYLIG